MALRDFKRSLNPTKFCLILIRKALEVQYILWQLNNLMQKIPYLLSFGILLFVPTRPSNCFKKTFNLNQFVIKISCSKAFLA